MKIVNVVGARPNLMKVAPLMEAFAARPGIQPLLVHTGQHYDANMSDLFFRQLGIPEPDLNLGVGSGSHALQTAEIMKGFEPVLLEHRPDAVLVVGDVNSTIACGLVAVKLGIALVHVEAGLRSFDRSMPEEINRILTDAISDLLFCTEPSGVEQPAARGRRRREDPPGRQRHDRHADEAPRARRGVRRSWTSCGLEAGGYAVLTLHRPSNVDDPAMLAGILGALEVVARDMPLVFPAHPRTRERLRAFGLEERLAQLPGLRLIEPAGYLDFLKLMAHARLVLTDSGGIQEETTILGVPCLTLRENTERPVTVELGTNQLVGQGPGADPGGLSQGDGRRRSRRAGCRRAGTDAPRAGSST